MIHIQVELANKIGRNVGLVFSKLKEGSELKLLLYKRLDGANRCTILSNLLGVLVTLMHSEYLPKRLGRRRASAKVSWVTALGKGKLS